MTQPRHSNTALLLIGYQNDYFSNDGVLRSVVEESAITNNVLKNTLSVIKSLGSSELPIIHTPIVFTKDYSELKDPVGILAAIKQHQAFQEGTIGVEVIKEIIDFGDRVIEMPGKRGLNAFSNTSLELFLKDNGINNIVLAGAVTSVCIDSTGRAAFEKGFNVFILENCTCGRTNFEQQFYCEDIFPIYATVIDSTTFLARLD